MRIDVYQLHMPGVIVNIGSSTAEPLRVCLPRARCCDLRGEGKCPESKQRCRAAYEGFPSSRDTSE